MSALAPSLSWLGTSMILHIGLFGVSFREPGENIKKLDQSEESDPPRPADSLSRKPRSVTPWQRLVQELLWKLCNTGSCVCGPNPSMPCKGLRDASVTCDSATIVVFSHMHESHNLTCTMLRCILKLHVVMDTALSSCIVIDTVCPRSPHWCGQCKLQRCSGRQARLSGPRQHNGCYSCGPGCYLKGKMWSNALSMEDCLGLLRVYFLFCIGFLQMQEACCVKGPGGLWAMFDF